MLCTLIPQSVHAHVHLPQSDVLLEGVCNGYTSHLLQLVVADVKMSQLGGVVIEQLPQCTASTSTQAVVGEICRGENRALQPA